jgi:hypothetical protein
LHNSCRDVLGGSALDSGRQGRDGHAESARHIEHHNLLFAVLAEMIKAGMWQSDMESLLDFIKIGCRHVSIIVDPRGVSWVPDNVKFVAEGILKEREGLPPR